MDGSAFVIGALFCALSGAVVGAAAVALLWVVIG